MELYLIRHAEAVPLGENNINDDADRPLTSNGTEQAKTVAAGLQRKGVNLELVLSSPLLRSRQTAEEIIKAWKGTSPQVQICEKLTPGKRPNKLARSLKGLEQKQVALVGHEPDLSRLAGWLIGSKKAHLALAKAGVAHISCENSPGRGAGTLVQLLTLDWMG